MRHGKKFNHLGRKTAHRKAMLSNMACSLIEHKRIKTTLAKAKALRKFVEPLITKSKNDTTHSRRIVFSQLGQKEAVTELFNDVASKVASRNGGYTRILRTGNRLGDNAEMCLIELVDYNLTYTSDKPAKKVKSTRRRSSGSSSKLSADVQNTDTIQDAEVVEETVSEETPVKKEDNQINDNQPKAEQTKEKDNPKEEEDKSE